MQDALWKKLRIGIVGAGRVGGNIAFQLARRGWHIASIFSRTDASARKVANAVMTGVAPTLESLFKHCDVAILTVGDSALPELCEQIQDFQHTTVRTLVHCSGVLPSSILGLAGLEFAKVSMHPIASIPPFPAKSNPFNGVIFGVEGDDFGVELARQLIADLDGKAQIIDPTMKPLYHAAGAFGSNFVYVLLAICEELLRESGLPRDAAIKGTATLAKKSIENYLKFGLPVGMTGPVARGDVATIAMHIEALRNSPYRELYLVASRIAAELAGKGEALAEILAHDETK